MSFVFTFLFLKEHKKLIILTYTHCFRDIGDEYSPLIKLKMIEFFHPHNERLANLLGRKIDLWATPTSFKEQMEKRKDKHP